MAPAKAAQKRAQGGRRLDGAAENTGRSAGAQRVGVVDADLERLLTFFDFPAEHRVHLRTTNPIESTFATVRLRQRVTKGAGSREAGLAMAYKLLDAAQERWRRVNAPHLVVVVRAGGVFIDGQLQERDSDQPTAERDAA